MRHFERHFQSVPGAMCFWWHDVHNPNPMASSCTETGRPHIIQMNRSGTLGLRKCVLFCANIGSVCCNLSVRIQRWGSHSSCKREPLTCGFDRAFFQLMFGQSVSLANDGCPTFFRTVTFLTRFDRCADWQPFHGHFYLANTKTHLTWDLSVLVSVNLFPQVGPQKVPSG